MDKLIIMGLVLLLCGCATCKPARDFKLREICLPREDSRGIHYRCPEYIYIEKCKPLPK